MTEYLASFSGDLKKKFSLTPKNRQVRTEKTENFFRSLQFPDSDGLVRTAPLYINALNTILES